MKNDEQSEFKIATRQKADLLFGPIPEPLAGGASLVLPIRTVSGYGRVSILGISAQTFTVLVEEANSPDGQFTQAGSFPSVLDAATGLQKVCEQVFPCGSFMQITVTNTGLTGQISFAGNGLPHGTA